VGWGAKPYFTEYDPQGHELFDGRIAGGNSSYRAYEFAWHAQPAGAPSIAVSRAAKGRTSVYASWNGATDIASWQLATGPSADSLQDERTSPRTGFETEIAVSAGARYAAVTALDAGGSPLATSTTVRLP
jgi:hypothetical protein